MISTSHEVDVVAPTDMHANQNLTCAPHLKQKLVYTPHMWRPWGEKKTDRIRVLVNTSDIAKLPTSDQSKHPRAQNTDMFLCAEFITSGVPDINKSDPRRVYF